MWVFFYPVRMNSVKKKNDFVDKNLRLPGDPRKLLITSYLLWQTERT